MIPCGLMPYDLIPYGLMPHGGTACTRSCGCGIQIRLRVRRCCRIVILTAGVRKILYLRGQDGQDCCISPLRSITFANHKRHLYSGRQSDITGSCSCRSRAGRTRTCRALARCGTGCSSRKVQGCRRRRRGRKIRLFVIPISAPCLLIRIPKL